MTRRDQVAFAVRLIGTVVGLSLVAWAFATSSWRRGMTLALLFAVVVGGAVVYHLLTSLARCPACRARTVNLTIGRASEKGKLFRCRRCGAVAYLREGFSWQRETTG